MSATSWTLAFGFVSPWLLAGGLALSAVPLVIHLLRRRQYVDRPWAAMQFLQAALQSQARRVRLESLVLLAVRMLLIGLAATALAQPYLDEAGGSLGAVAGRQRVLVLDTSLSMSAGKPGATLLDQGRTMATHIVETAPTGDSFSLVRICRIPPLAVIQQAAYDRGAVVDQIQRLSATQQRGDVAGALRAARGCLRDGGRAPRAEVILISDFQRTNWTPESGQAREEIASLMKELADNARVTCLRVSQSVSANLAVTELEPVYSPGTDPGAVDVEATVLNPGAQPAMDVSLEVFAGNRAIGSVTLDIPAGERATAQVPLRGLLTTDGAVRAEIPADALADDNRRWAVLRDRGPLEVLLVNGRPRTADRRGAADFVRLALSPSPEQGAEAAIVTTIINDDRLGATELRRFECIHLCNVALFSESDAVRLRSYVEGGGGLVISLGDQVQPSGYRALQEPADGALLPGELIEIAGERTLPEDAVRFAPGDYLHPVIRPFAGNPDAGLLTTDVLRYWRLRLSDKAPVETVLNFSTGDPAIIARRWGSGRIFIVTTSLDDAWSNWALWPSFVPVVHELTRAAAGNSERSRLVGDVLTLRLPADDFGVSVEHQSPDGAMTEIPKKTNADGTSTITTVAETAGVHALQLGPPLAKVEKFAVNVDAEESRLATLDREEFAQLSPDGEIRYVQEWQPEAIPAATSHGGSMTYLLLLAVLGLLLIEQLMAWNFRLGAFGLLLLVAGMMGAAATGRSEIVLAGLASAAPAVWLAWWRRSRQFRKGATAR